jgi:hypothetical protein
VPDVTAAPPALVVVPHGKPVHERDVERVVKCVGVRVWRLISVGLRVDVIMVHGVQAEDDADPIPILESTAIQL